MKRYYTTQLEQRIFIEEDPNTDCKDYKDATYEDCDNIYIRSKLQRHYPPGFMPMWATEDSSNVTQHIETSSPDFHEEYHGILSGTEESGDEEGPPIELMTHSF